MTGTAALLGALCGAAAVVAVAAWLGTLPPARTARPQRTARRPHRLGLRLGSAALAGATAGAVTRWPVAALAAAAAAFAVPGLRSERAARQAELARIEGIAGWAEMLRDVIGAAAGLEQAITATAPLAPAAIAPQVQGLARRLATQPLPTALRALAAELDDVTGDLVAAALLLAAGRTPGQLTPLLGSLAQAARAEVAMRLRIEAARARTRTSARIVTGCAVGFSLGLVALNRPYLSAYDTLGGQAVLALVAGCYAAAGWWLARSSRAERPERFLAPAEPGGADHRAALGAGR